MRFGQLQLPMLGLGTAGLAKFQPDQDGTRLAPWPVFEVRLSGVVSRGNQN